MFLPLTNSTIKLSFFRLSDCTCISSDVGVKGGNIDMLFYQRISSIFSLSLLIITPILNSMSLERFYTSSSMLKKGPNPNTFELISIWCSV